MFILLCCLKYANINVKIPRFIWFKIIRINRQKYEYGLEVVKNKLPVRIFKKAFAKRNFGLINEVMRLKNINWRLMVNWGLNKSCVDFDFVSAKFFISKGATSMTNDLRYLFMGLYVDSFRRNEKFDQTFFEMVNFLVANGANPRFAFCCSITMKIDRLITDLMVYINAEELKKILAKIKKNKQYSIYGVANLRMAKKILIGHAKCENRHDLVKVLIYFE